MLLHQLEALGLLFRFGLGQRQVQAGRHGPEQHFHAFREDDPLAELARLLARRQHQRLLGRRQLAEFGDLLDLIRRHGQADPPLDHVEHGLGGLGQIVHVLRGQPIPRAELAPHLGDLDHIGRQQRVLGDDVTFVGHVQDGTTQELVALGDVVHGADQRDVGDRELGVVAFAGVGRQIDDGDVGLRPGCAGTIEHLAVGALAEHVHRIGHFQQAGAPNLRQRGIAAALAQRVAYIPCEHRTMFSHTTLGGIQNALADQRTIGAGHAGLFLVLAARDHQSGGDFQFAQHVALLIRLAGLGRGRLLLIQRIGIERLHIAGRFDQPARIGERGQAHARPGGQLDPVHRHAQLPGELGEQAERIARLDDEHARAVDGRDLVEDDVERGRLARASRPEQEQVGVHLPVEPVEWIEGDDPAAPVEEGDAGAARALAASPHGRQVRRVLGEH